MTLCKPIEPVNTMRKSEYIWRSDRSASNTSIATSSLVRCLML